MIICHSRQFIFVHIHKFAGTSISAAIEPSLSRNDVVLGGMNDDQFNHGGIQSLGLHKHSTAQEIRNALGAETWDSYFKFSTVRHPIHRLISFYEFIRRVHDQNRSSSIFTALSEKVGMPSKTAPAYPDEEPWTWPGMKAHLESGDFSEFIRSNHLKQEQGINPQTRALTDGHGDLLVNHVVKVEQLESEWSNLGTRIGVSAELNFANESPRQFYNVRDYLQDGDLEYLKSFYADDFTLFEYSGLRF